jgi:hypothetical protein
MRSFVVFDLAAQNWSQLLDSDFDSRVGLRSVNQKSAAAEMLISISGYNVTVNRMRALATILIVIAAHSNSQRAHNQYTRIELSDPIEIQSVAAVHCASPVHARHTSKRIHSCSSASPLFSYNLVDAISHSKIRSKNFVGRKTGTPLHQLQLSSRTAVQSHMHTRGSDVLFVRVENHTR